MEGREREGGGRERETSMHSVKYKEIQLNGLPSHSELFYLPSCSSKLPVQLIIRTCFTSVR